jgi:hypothetical protein
MGFDLQEMQQILAGRTEAAEIQLDASKTNVLFSATAVRTKALYDGQGIAKRWKAADMMGDDAE